MPGDGDLAAGNAPGLDIAAPQVLGDALEPVLIETSPDRVGLHGLPPVVHYRDLASRAMRGARMGEGTGWPCHAAAPPARPSLVARRSRNATTSSAARSGMPNATSVTPISAQCASRFGSGFPARARTWGSPPRPASCQAL